MFVADAVTVLLINVTQTKPLRFAYFVVCRVGCSYHKINKIILWLCGAVGNLAIKIPRKYYYTSIGENEILNHENNSFLVPLFIGIATLLVITVIFIQVLRKRNISETINHHNEKNTTTNREDENK